MPIFYADSQEENGRNEQFYWPDYPGHGPHLEKMVSKLLSDIEEDIKLIIFLCTGYAHCPFFILFIFRKGRVSMKHLVPAIMDYRKYKEEKKVLLRYIQKGLKKLFILIGGRKKRVVLQALGWLPENVWDKS